MEAYHLNLSTPNIPKGAKMSLLTVSFTHEPSQWFKYLHFVLGCCTLMTDSKEDIENWLFTETGWNSAKK